MSGTRARARLGGAGRLLLPGLITILLIAPSLLPGTLAFAIRRDFDLSVTTIGAAVSGYYLLSTVATRAAVPLARRYDPLTMTRACLLTSAICVPASALLGTTGALLAGCLIAGTTNGLATPSANMLIALNVPERHRGLAFGIRVSAVPGAAGLCALAAYVVATHDVAWPAAYLAYGLACLVGIGCTFLAPPTTLADTEDEAEGANGASRGGTLHILAAGGLLASIAGSATSPFLVDGLIAGGADPGAAALLFGLSAWIGVSARIIAGIVADRVPGAVLHLVAAAGLLVFGSVGMLILGFGRGTPMLAVGTVLTFALGWAWPGLLHHATLTVHRTQMARATAALQTGTYVGALIGPLGFGLIVEHLSFTWAWSGYATMLLASAAMLALASRRVRRAGERAVP
ncbi:MFS transporter [Aeromicrobium senzhongii]|uniref:MFS transporter n=1 Tax=Aeromicrobium senzhongii TaxID=2663859 RepID=A0ABX6SQX1_9ACTN|nr:MFS transporter [Aeromicrobium senzhongii]QNL93758.1 MFS transporter [Aeromicrobium senzhongii]